MLDSYTTCWIVTLFIGQLCHLLNSHVTAWIVMPHVGQLVHLLDAVTPVFVFARPLVPAANKADNWMGIFESIFQEQCQQW